jgi:hypothetical protein
MFTSFFKKSTPFNYTIVCTAALIVFFLSQPAVIDAPNLLAAILSLLGRLILVFALLFTLNFVLKKNNLCRDSSFGILFYLFFLMIFPKTLADTNLLLAAFFIVLAIRRVISMHSQKSIREKVFDASMWIFVASAFHFWCISFIALVFISVLFHVSRDYRNWFLPFLALFGVASAFGFISLAFAPHLIDNIYQRSAIDFKLDYFTDQSQNIALSVYTSIAIFFLFSLLLTLSARPLVVQSAYKKIIASFFLGLFVFIISPNKSNELLIFSFAPLAAMATAHIELPQHTIRREFAFVVFTVAAFWMYFLQL